MEVGLVGSLRLPARPCNRESLSCLVPAPHPDYAIGTSVFPTSGVSGEPFSGSFVVVNGGGGDGASAVAWRLFLSVHNVHDSADTAIASGVIARLVAGHLTWNTAEWRLLYLMQPSTELPMLPGSGLPSAPRGPGAVSTLPAAPCTRATVERIGPPPAWRWSVTLQVLPTMR